MYSAIFEGWALDAHGDLVGVGCSVFRIFIKKREGHMTLSHYEINLGILTINYNLECFYKIYKADIYITFIYSESTALSQAI